MCIVWLPVNVNVFKVISLNNKNNSILKKLIFFSAYFFFLFNVHCMASCKRECIQVIPLHNKSNKKYFFFLFNVHLYGFL